MKSFSPEFLTVLMAYGWPGNVRELIQALEKAVVNARDEPVLFPKHLPEHVRIRLAREAVLQKRPLEPPPGEAPPARSAGPASLKDFRDAEVARAESDYLASLMRKTGGNVVRSLPDLGPFPVAPLYAPEKIRDIAFRLAASSRPASSGPPGFRPLRRIFVPIFRDARCGFRRRLSGREPGTDFLDVFWSEAP